jgi:hypothetical protein
VAAESVRRRVLSRRLASAAGDPVFVGAAAFIAVASAAVSVILGAGDDSLAGTLTVFALSLLLPLWSLTSTPWPSELRRAQARVAAGLGILSVLLLGLLSTEEPGALHRSYVVTAVLVSICASGALQVLPRRHTASSYR